MPGAGFEPARSVEQWFLRPRGYAIRLPGRWPRILGRKVRRQRDLLRAAAFGVVPRLVRAAVAPLVRLGAAEREDRAPRLAAVGQPPAHGGRHARQLAGAQLAILALD